MACRVSCPDLATMLRNEIHGSKEEERIGALAGFVWYGQMRQYPDETIIEVMLASKEISADEIISAINFYTQCEFCMGDPDEVARHLCDCLPQA